MAGAPNIGCPLKKPDSANCGGTPVEMETETHSRLDNFMQLSSSYRPAIQTGLTLLNPYTFFGFFGCMDIWRKNCPPDLAHPILGFFRKRCRSIATLRAVILMAPLPILFSGVYHFLAWRRDEKSLGGSALGITKDSLTALGSHLAGFVTAIALSGASKGCKFTATGAAIRIATTAAVSFNLSYDKPIVRPLVQKIVRA